MYILENWLQALPFVVGLVFLPLVYTVTFHFMERWVLHPVSHDGTDEIQSIEGGGMAAAVNRFGVYAGIVAALGLTMLVGPDVHYWLMVASFYASGLITIVTFIVFHHVLDRVVVRRVNNAVLVREGNLAAGITEASAYISLGLIVGGSFAGGGQAFWPGILSALLFTTLGVFVLMVIYTCYTLAWARVRDDVDAKIGEGDMVSAIDASSILLATAFTLMFSIAGDFEGWLTDIAAFGVAVLSSTVFVPMGRYLAGKFMQATDRSSGSLARALQLGAVTIGIGIMAGIM